MYYRGATAAIVVYVRVLQSAPVACCVVRLSRLLMRRIVPPPLPPLLILRCFLTHVNARGWRVVVFRLVDLCDGFRYDVTNPASFEGAKSWVRELQRRGDPHVVIALAANKVRSLLLLLLLLSRSRAGSVILAMPCPSLGAAPGLDGRLHSQRR